MSLNVNGLKTKVMFVDFLKLVNDTGIFILLETWIEEKDMTHFTKYFKTFNLYWKTATRENRSGRAKGGMLIGVSRDIKEYTKVKDEQFFFDILVKTSKEFIHIVPIYLSCSNWALDFDNLRDFVVNKYSDKVILIGDFNARTGADQDFKPERIFNQQHLKIRENRKSRDKISNTNGRRLIEFFNDMSFIILNGRVENDSLGEFTFHGVMGKSVIDYVAATGSVLKDIMTFEVGKYLHSDHFPLYLSLEIQLNKDITSSELLPIIKYIPSKNILYSEKINHVIEQWEQQDTGVQLVTAKVLVQEISRIGESVLTKRTSEYKNKWYDKECEEARKLSFKFFSILRENSSSEFYRVVYSQLNKSYKELCEEKKKKYFNDLGGKLRSIKSTTDWWKWVREFKEETGNIMGNITSQEFGDHFKNLLSLEQEGVGVQYALQDITDVWLDTEISLEEINAALSNLKDNKAPGEERLPVDFFKYGSDKLKELLVVVLNKVARGEDGDWRNMSIILPFFKKGDKDLVDNYRCISLVNPLDKVYASVLYNRLFSWVNCHNILKENQAGFRAGYSTADNLFNLNFLIEYLWNNGKKKVYCFFIDFKSAFDGVNRSALFFKLHSMGVSLKFLQMLGILYKETVNSVWNGSNMSNIFETSTGVKQGCILSPLLFALFLNDLVDFIKGGVRVREQKINMLKYADDIVFMSDDPKSLQLMINRLKTYCETWGLRVNMMKSQIMVMRKYMGIVNEKWYYGSEEIKVVDSYKYLGVQLTPNLKLDEHLKSKIVIAKYKVNSLWQTFVQNKHVNLVSKLNLFDSVGRSGVCYASQYWGYKYYESIEQYMRDFVKRLFNLPSTTPNYGLRVECGIKELYLFTLKCHMNYVYNALFKMSEDRFPNIFVRIGIELKMSWFSKWAELGAECGVSFEERNEVLWKQNIARILQHVENRHLNACIERARETRTHGLFHELSYLNGGGFLKLNLSSHVQGWLLRARIGMMGLNDVHYRPEQAKLCSLCNLQSSESVLHYVGECPMYQNYRYEFFGKVKLTKQEVIDILNGENWNNLYLYLSRSWSYRSFLVAEFNF